MEIKQLGVADLGRLDKKWGGLDIAWLVFCQRLDSSLTICRRDFGQLCAGELGQWFRPVTFSIC